MNNLHLIYVDDRGLTKSFMEKVHEHISLLASYYWRVGPGAWVVASTLSAQEWLDKLKFNSLMEVPYAAFNAGYTGHSLIIKLDVADRQGLMDPRFWPWLDQAAHQNVLHVKVEPKTEAK